MNFFESINRFIASSIGVLNAVLAIVLVVICGFGGILVGGFLGFVAGLVLGAALALIVCGTLAVLINIRDLLAASAQRVGSQGSP